MLRLLCLIVAVTYIQCANHNGLSVDQIAQQVWADMKPTGNPPSIDVTALDTEFISRFDHNGDGFVQEHEFVLQWQHAYHDQHATAETFFHLMDIHADGRLSADDFVAHLGVYDTNGDGALSYDEFLNFMHYVHPDSTHHGHGHHGHPDQALG